MNEAKKPVLKEIKVQSFNTVLNESEQSRLKGGEDIGITSMPIFCKREV